ncbi:hypothetical protein E2329_22955 [Salmonella enterica subsp. enterica]|nr:hypothetical protein [Salmonella enterica subsp. enterica serovar Paratyphi A]
MTVQLKFKVKGNLKEYQRGEIVKFEGKEEKRLIKEGIAIPFEGAITNDQVNDGPFEEIPPEEYEKLFKEIDDAGKTDKVLEAAINVGVELSSEDKRTKKSIIDRIIEQGMEQDVLEELSEGE